MAVLRKKIGEILMDMRVLDQGQVNTILKDQQVSGSRFGEILLERGLCRLSDLLAALGAQFGMPSVDLAKETPPHNIQTLLESSYAEKHGVLPFRLEEQGRNKIYHVALMNPRDVQVLQELEFKLQGKIKAYVGAAAQIKATIRKYYYAQEYGYDISFHEGRGFRHVEEAPESAPERVMGQVAPPPKAPVDKHPAATSLSDLSLSSQRLDALEAEVAKLQKMMTTLLKLLAKQGVVSRDEFMQALQKQG